jgi:hypothetical protein
MVEANQQKQQDSESMRVDDSNSGGIIKESFGDSGQVFQKEGISDQEMNSGLIWDKKLEMNKGEFKTFKPFVQRDINEFGQPGPIDENDPLFHKLSKEE